MSQNLYPTQDGPVPYQEPLMPPSGQPYPPQTQPMPQPQPIAPAAQEYQQPPTYQPPVPNQQPIVVNQYVAAVPLKLKTTPAAIVCPHCNSQITTVVETQFNCGNCCFCFWFFWCWLCVSLCNDKDLNCTDATHKCPNCNQVIQQYTAC